MSLQFLKIFALLAITIVLGSSLCYAQARHIATAVIPFDFRVGEKKVECGEYMIEQPAVSSMNLTVVIRKKSGEAVSMVNMLNLQSGAAKAATAILIFDRYGDSFHFSEIQLPQIDFFGRMRKPKHEIELVRPRKTSGHAIARIVIPVAVHRN